MPEHLESDLKELGYKIIWKQTLAYNAKEAESQIIIIAAVTKEVIGKKWIGVVKFSARCLAEGSGSTEGFLNSFTMDSRDEVVDELNRIFNSVSLAPGPPSHFH